MKHLILAALNALTPSALDTESPAERCARLEPVAAAYAEAAETCADPIRCAAVLIVTGDAESRHAEHVQAGRCRVHRGECDGGRSRGPLQINRGAVDRVTWHALGRYDVGALRTGALEGLRIWRAGLTRCRGDLACARARYRGARSVSAADRAFARRVLRTQAALSRAGGES